VLTAFIAILICIGIIIASASKTPQANIQTEQQQQQNRQQKKERSQAVYRGLLNPHSDKIPEIAATAKEDVRMYRDIGLLSLDPFAKPFNLQSFLRSAACDADAIVLGRVKEQTSRLTEDESFIYTINELDVQTILKNNSAQPIKPGEVISAVRTGGAIELNGRKIVAVFAGSKPLEPEQTYLLFLTFVPEKGFYVADNISYQIKNGKIIKLTAQQLEPELESGKDANSFTSSVRTAIAAPCEVVGGE
jgi:hypothetical protein